jgi:hypothetical protein
MNHRNEVTRLTRRGFFSASAALGLGALVGCSPSPPVGGPLRGRSITVFVNAGLDKMFQEHFADTFTASTGAVVTLDAGWWDAIGKLKASPKGEQVYDLVLTDATQGYPRGSHQIFIRNTLFRSSDWPKD